MIGNSQGQFKYKQTFRKMGDYLLSCGHVAESRANTDLQPHCIIKQTLVTP